VGRLLDDASQRQPLLVVLEDLHWADASSLRLLAFIVDTLAANVLLFCTRRTVEASAPEALKTALAAMARNCAERIRLEGLDIDDVSSLLAVEVGPHPRPLADAIAERTAENLFSVIEFARLLHSRMITDPEVINDLAIPEGIPDVLRLRLHDSPPRACAPVDPLV
jgi:predicted ATPase